MSNTTEPPICRYVTYDPDSESYPFDLTASGSERISFSLDEAKRLKRELGKMILWYVRREEAQGK